MFESGSAEGVCGLALMCTLGHSATNSSTFCRVCGILGPDTATEVKPQMPECKDAVNCTWNRFCLLPYQGDTWPVLMGVGKSDQDKLVIFRCFAAPLASPFPLVEQCHERPRARLLLHTFRAHEPWPDECSPPPPHTHTPVTPSLMLHV